MSSMEPGIDVMVIWPMAAMEAKATCWAEIEPAHLLCAALKFAELDADNLDQLGQVAGHRRQLLEAHERVVRHLSQQRAIGVPEVSTALRRRLRRSGNASPVPDGGILHRSPASRDGFRRAESKAESDGRDRFDAVDLIDAILAEQEGWIARVMDSLDLSHAAETTDPSIGLPETWRGIVQPLCPDDASRPAGHSDVRRSPACQVAADTIREGATRPLLLIAEGSRTARDVVEELAAYRGTDRQLNCRIFAVDGKGLADRLSSDDFSLLDEFLRWASDKTKGRSVFFIDSLHCCLAERMGDAGFVRRFLAWLSETDGRFVFGIAQGQYHALMADRAQWKGIFRPLWIHEDPRKKELEL
jgi:hypothetical protein